MKTLLLLRHAKSSWKNPDLSDFERPLNGRGKQAAPLIGRYLRGQKIKVDLILSSPAERARQTVALVSAAANFTGVLRYDERIYEATDASLLEVISQTEESAGVLLLVGHNPGLEDLLLRLTGEARRMPTAALAAIIFETERWSKVIDQKGQLKWLVNPKELSGD